MAAMTEITGTIRIEGGRVVALEHVTGANLAEIYHRDLARILPILFDPGWKLTGDYVLTINKTLGAAGKSASGSHAYVSGW